MKIYFVFGFNSNYEVIEAYSTDDRYDAKFILAIIGEEHFKGAELLEGDVPAEDVDKILDMDSDELFMYYHLNYDNFNSIEYYFPDEE